MSSYNKRIKFPVLFRAQRTLSDLALVNSDLCPVIFIYCTCTGLLAGLQRLFDSGPELCLLFQSEISISQTHRSARSYLPVGPLLDRAIPGHLFLWPVLLLFISLALFSYRNDMATAHTFSLPPPLIYMENN